jgi:hypothetical protein
LSANLLISIFSELHAIEVRHVEIKSIAEQDAVLNADWWLARLGYHVMSASLRTQASLSTRSSTISNSLGNSFCGRDLIFIGSLNASINIGYPFALFSLPAF